MPGYLPGAAGFRTYVRIGPVGVEISDTSLSVMVMEGIVGPAVPDGSGVQPCRSHGLRARGETVRAQNITVRALGETLRAQNDTVRAPGETLRAQSVTVHAPAETLRAQSVTVRALGEPLRAKCRRARSE